MTFYRNQLSYSTVSCKPISQLLAFRRLVQAYLKMSVVCRIDNDPPVVSEKRTLNRCLYQILKMKVDTIEFSWITYFIAAAILEV